MGSKVNAWCGPRNLQPGTHNRCEWQHLRCPADLAIAVGVRATGIFSRRLNMLLVSERPAFVRHVTEPDDGARCELHKEHQRQCDAPPMLLFHGRSC